MPGISNCVFGGGGGSENMTVIFNEGITGTNSKEYTYDTGSQKERNYVIEFSGIAEFNTGPSNAKIFGSNDNVSWEVLSEFSLAVNKPYGNNPWYTKELTTEYRYLKMNLVNQNGGSRLHGLMVGCL